jgi:hypothetical protein
MSVEKVRCKLRCTSKTLHPHHLDDGNTVQGASLTFTAVHGATLDQDGKFVSYQQSCEENKLFGQWTPSASFSMYVVNEAAHAMFEEGGEYYVDLTPAPTREHHG